jgi:hypothetical protein
VDDANPGLESCAEPLLHPVCRTDFVELIENPFTQNSGHPRTPIVALRNMRRPSSSSMPLHCLQPPSVRYASIMSYSDAAFSVPRPASARLGFDVTEPPATPVSSPPAIPP